MLLLLLHFVVLLSTDFFPLCNSNLFVMDFLVAVTFCWEREREAFFLGIQIDCASILFAVVLPHKQFGWSETRTNSHPHPHTHTHSHTCSHIIYIPYIEYFNCLCFWFMTATSFDLFCHLAYALFVRPRPRNVRPNTRATQCFSVHLALKSIILDFNFLFRLYLLLFF